MARPNKKQEAQVELPARMPSPVETFSEAVAEAIMPLARPLPTAQAKVIVAPVYGVMHHPFLNLYIDGLTELPGIDSWTQCQIDSGKLVLQ